MSCILSNRPSLPLTRCARALQMEEELGVGEREAFLDAQPAVTPPPPPPPPPPVELLPQVNVMEMPQVSQMRMHLHFIGSNQPVWAETLGCLVIVWTVLVHSFVWAICGLIFSAAIMPRLVVSGDTYDHYVDNAKRVGICFIRYTLIGGAIWMFLVGLIAGEYLKAANALIPLLGSCVLALLYNPRNELIRVVPALRRTIVVSLVLFALRRIQLAVSAVAFAS